MESVGEIDGLTKRFRNVVALEDISFNVPEGSGFFLLGPNGSGKTTLVRLMTGTQRPTEGRVSILGEDPYRRPDLLALRMGVAYEDHYLPPWASARAYLRFTALTKGLSEEVLAPAADLFHVRDYWDREMGTYSAGMRKRVMLAQAWLGEPEFLLLDEPYSALDPEGRRLLAERLRERQAAGQTTLVATHLAETIAPPTHLALLLNGSLEAVGPIGNLADLYGARATSLAVTDVAAAVRVLLKAGMTSITVDGERVLIHGGSEAETRAREALEAAGITVETAAVVFDLWTIFRRVLAGAEVQKQSPSK